MTNNDQLQKQQLAMEMKSKKELLEEEEREKEKKRMAALYYFTAAYLDRVEKRKMMDAAKRIERSSIFNFYQVAEKEKMNEACRFIMQYALVNKKFIEHKKEYFTNDVEEATIKNIKKGLKDLNINEDCFSTVIMCAAKKFIKSFCEKVMGRGLPPKEESEIQKVKKECTKSVAALLTGQKENQQKTLAQILKEGLANACQFFGKAKTEDEAMEWSSMTSEILYIFDQKPELVKQSGLSEKQLSIATRVAELGDEVRKGMMAVEVLIANEMNPKLKLSEQQKQCMIETAFAVKAKVFEKQSIVKQWDEPEIAPVQPKVLSRTIDKEVPVLKIDN